MSTQLLRGVGCLEGISLLLLLFVAMPLKYVWGYSAWVPYVGMAHGVLFLAFLVVLAPLVAVAVGWGFGFSGVAMGVLFLMTATPATASGYIMAKAMGANDVAAANIVGITTFVGMVSAALGIAGLRGMGWM